MSEPKRWFVTLKDQIIATKKSVPFWADLPKDERMDLVVRYEDYARLKAEVERLELEVFAFDRTIKQASCHYDNRLEDIRQLQAQVERLTKAGDAMQDDLKIQVWPWASQVESIDQWNAAKEGNPQP